MLYDLIIIGGDSAGLTAGIYAGRKKLNTLILTKQIGGQSLLTDTIENFPGFDLISGKDLIFKMRGQVEKYGAQIRDGEIVDSIKKINNNFLIKTKNADYEARSIIIATGKSPRRLNIPGEKEFENKGVSFCSICDAPLFGGKNVVVIGGGNSGLESAVDLLKYADKIYVLDHGPVLKGDKIFQEKLRQSNRVEFITDAEMREIKGGGLIEKIVYKDKKTEEIKEISVGGVFVNIGWVPATGFLKEILNLNEKGEIIVNPKTMETSIRGIFAAGDVADMPYKQNVIAASHGAISALSAYNYLLNI